MTFKDSVKYLYSLGNEVEAMKLGLDNTRKLLAALRDPQDRFLKVQIAGTNGKGSVCAFLDAICLSAGIKTGLFTSPHLISITERIRINGVDVSDDDFAMQAAVVRETAERLLADGEIEYRPTFFEQVTAIALLAFAGAGLELAILETGLGGRLDATTAANAEITAITRIDLDHQEYLGETIEEIAAEKAAIIHEGSKVVIGRQDPDVMHVIYDRCLSLRANPTLAESVTVGVKGGNAGRREYANSTLVFGSDLSEYADVRLGLLGRHQIDNAKVALLLAETLQDHFPISSQNIKDGLQSAAHPGRLEFSGKYLFDGAHNVAGASALREFLDEFVPQPITLVFGAMKGKDIAGIAEILFPRADKLILTRPENSRSMAAKEILPLIPDGFSEKNIFLTDDVTQALAKANEITPENGLIVVTGSLYLVGEAKKILNN